MGWTHTRGASRKDIIKKVTEQKENESGSWETIAYCSRGNVVWAVLQITKKKDGQPFSSSRFIMCYLLRSDKDFGWGYKDISEDMGPAYYTCPLKYFSLCPDYFIQDYPHAVEWRANVRESYRLRQELIKNFKEAKETQPDDGVDPEGKFCIMFPQGLKTSYYVMESVRPLIGKYEATRYRLKQRMIGDSKVVDLQELMDIHHKFRQEALDKIK